VSIPLDDDPALMAPPRPGAGDELGLGGVSGVGSIEGFGEAAGAQAVELPPMVISPLQASLPAESAINNRTTVPAFKLLLY